MNAVQEIFTSTVLKLRLFHALEAVINVLFFQSYAKTNVRSYSILQKNPNAISFFLTSSEGKINY